MNWKIIVLKIFCVEEFRSNSLHVATNFFNLNILMIIISVKEHTHFVHEVEIEGLKLELSRVSCIQGYHVYKDIWYTDSSWRKCKCVRECYNAKDRYAVQCVAVKKDGTITGHLPMNLTRYSLHRKCLTFPTCVPSICSRKYFLCLIFVVAWAYDNS